ncbi:hypothetical protein [Streptomyces sp. NPDC059863]|uniref:hypothetical protein n=1 Tax=unclassified Streptomyces TaxID=2593676 RepID=UPI0036505099
MSDQLAPADTAARQQLEPAADAARAFAARTREYADQLAAALEGIAAAEARARRPRERPAEQHPASRRRRPPQE